MAELSQPTQKLIKQYQVWAQSLKRPEGISVIRIDEVATAAASFYEKIRGVIDWREEHLLRRAAIERMLRRRTMLRKNGEKIANPLVLDLIRSGHFPNNLIPEIKIGEVQKSIDKYIFILENSSSLQTKKEKSPFLKWIFEIAACEIEAILAPPIKEESLMDYMEIFMKEKIRLNEGVFIAKKTKEEEKNTQIFIAIRRALFKLDGPIITFHLLKRRFANWLNFQPAELEEITKNIRQIKKQTEDDLNSPLAEKFYEVAEKYDTAYLIIGDIISKHPNEAQKTLGESAALEKSITEAYSERFIKLKQRIKRAAIYSTLSIFITKVFMALSLEIPIDKYITGEFSNTALAINILIPPFLMFLLTATVKPPGRSNLQRVIMEITKIVYSAERKEIYEIKNPQKRSAAFKAFIDTIYFLTYLVSFGIIVWLLNKMDFGTLSIIIFLLFLCLITFAGVKIRQRAKELEMEEKKEGFWESLGDWLVLPIIRAGKWLSAEWEKHNTLVIIFNSLVDMPFQIFVEFLEQWRYFLKEKKGEIH